MKSILEKSTREELAARIRLLNNESTARWGKMNVYQMIRHCVLCEELYLGKRTHERALMGYLFGRIGLTKILAEDKLFPQNAPTANAFKVMETNGDVAKEKEQWISLLEEYKAYPDQYTHWFFGKMTGEQVGYFVYKHDDHHLRQFGV